jgi:hypothetical protein
VHWKSCERQRGECVVPLKSKAQERYLWATDPKLAKKYEEETTKKQRAKLPEKVKKKAAKKK